MWFINLGSDCFSRVTARNTLCFESAQESAQVSAHLSAHLSAPEPEPEYGWSCADEG